MLQVGAWTHAEKIMNRLPIHYTVAQSHIAEALQKLIHRTIQPIHKRYEFIGKRGDVDNYRVKNAIWPINVFILLILISDIAVLTVEFDQKHTNH